MGDLDEYADEQMPDLAEGQRRRLGFGHLIGFTGWLGPVSWLSSADWTAHPRAVTGEGGVGEHGVGQWPGWFTDTTPLTGGPNARPDPSPLAGLNGRLDAPAVARPTDQDVGGIGMGCDSGRKPAGQRAAGGGVDNQYRSDRPQSIAANAQSQ